MFRPLVLAAVALVLTAGPAPARAGDLGVRVSAHGPHGGIDLHFGKGRSYGYGSEPRCHVPRYETRRLWVPAERRRVWVPPVHETWIDACGRAHTRVVAPGRWEWVVEPGHHVTRTVRVYGGAPSYGPIVAH